MFFDVYVYHFKPNKHLAYKSANFCLKKKSLPHFFQFHQLVISDLNSVKITSAWPRFGKNGS